MNVVGTLMAESAFKKKSGLPFVVVMTNIRIGECLIMLCSLQFSHLFKAFQWGQFFHGWNWHTIAVAATLLMDTWLSGFMVKRLSSVTKTACKCGTMLALYAKTLYATSFAVFTWRRFMSAFGILLATGNFARVSERERLASEEEKGG